MSDLSVVFVRVSDHCAVEFLPFSNKMPIPARGDQVIVDFPLMHGPISYIVYYVQHDYSGSPTIRVYMKPIIGC